MLWGFKDNKKNKEPINVAYVGGQLREYESNSTIGNPLFRVLDSHEEISSNLTLSQGYNVCEVDLIGGPYYIEEFLILNHKVTLESVSPSNYAYVLSYEPIYNSNNKIEKVNLFIYSSVGASADYESALIKFGTKDE